MQGLTRVKAFPNDVIAMSYSLMGSLASLLLNVLSDITKSKFPGKGLRIY
jgi:hypothetical protein